MALNTDELKAKVLDLAIRGKLVDSSKFEGETGSQLIERIKSERDKLVLDKVIRKKKIDSIAKEEVLFDIHENWVWSQFGIIADFRKGPFGSSITKSMFVPKSDDTIKVYEQKNAIKKKHDIGEYYITKEKYQQLKGFEVETNDIIISCAGTIGEAYQLPVGIEKGIINQALMRTRLSQYIVPQFFLYYLEVILTSHVTSKSKGSAIKNIPPLKILNAIPFPIMSIEEQIAIVAKVEELFKIIDNLSIDAESQLTILEQLRQKTLDLAIRGKLVPQDPNDEPASELIKKIQEERNRLIKEKKIKKPKELAPIEKDEIPFEIPESWEWVRLGNSLSNTGQKKPDKKFTYIDVSSINNKLGIIGDEVNVLQPEKAPSRARKLVNKESIIYSTVRPYLLNVAVVDKNFEFEPIVSTAFAVMNLHAGCKSKYLYYYLRSQTFIDYVESQMVGLAYPAINDKNLMLGIFPLPPVNEQFRIVKKIESIMLLVDQMEEKLKRKVEIAGKLMESEIS